MKGRLLSKEEIFRLGNGTKIWFDGYYYKELAYVENAQVKSIARKNNICFLTDLEDREIYEWKENVKMKEYSVKEVIAMIKEEQEYKCTDRHWNIKTITKTNDCIRFEFSVEGTSVSIDNNAKFTLVQTPVTFIEAVQAYSDGKNIECKLKNNESYSYDYKANKSSLDMGSYLRSDTNDISAISTKEILEGVWFIDAD